MRWQIFIEIVENRDLSRNKDDFRFFFEAKSSYILTQKILYLVSNSVKYIICRMTYLYITMYVLYICIVCIYVLYVYMYELCYDRVHDNGSDFSPKSKILKVKFLNK